MSSFNQTTTGDFDISTGNLVVNQDIATNAAAKLGNLFGFAKGEWFIDTRQGFPYLQFVFVKNPNMNLLFDLFRQTLAAPPGVATVNEINLDFDIRARRLNTSFIVTAATGQKIVGGLATPFIVQTSPGAQ